MDPSDVPSQSPIHSSRTFFDPTNMMGQTPLLHSPPLAHEHRYGLSSGLAQMPSAFSVIGRRPSFPSASSHHHDYNTSLSHDPLMVSATSPGLPRSPTTTTGSWWRPPSNSHAQSMNNTDIFGNPLLWLPHDQDHMHPHEALGYHNPQTYRNFEILNGSSSGGYYASGTRFFPEAGVSSHPLHNIPTLSKDRPISWDERLGHAHGLMLDPSGNGFPSWQEIHQPKTAEKPRKPSSELIEEKRNQVLPSNRSSNFEDNNLFKSVKQSNKYQSNINMENQVGASSLMSANMSNIDARPHERLKYSRQETSMPLENVTSCRTQTESNVQSIPVSRNMGISSWKPDLTMNPGQYKRDSVISTLDVAPASSMYSNQAFPTPAVTAPVQVAAQSNKLAISGTTLNPSKVPRQSGGKPPLLERFREAGITRNDDESSSGDGSSDGAEDEDESDSDDDISEDEMSVDGEEQQKPPVVERVQDQVGEFIDLFV